MKKHPIDRTGTRRAPRTSFITCALLVAASQSGCGFLNGMPETPSSCLIYAGVRRDVEAITGDRPMGDSCMPVEGPVVLLDVPLSLILDTFALPFTLVYEIYRPHGPGQEHSSKPE